MKKLIYILLIIAIIASSILITKMDLLKGNLTLDLLNNINEIRTNQTKTEIIVCLVRWNESDPEIDLDSTFRINLRNEMNKTITKLKEYSYNTNYTYKFAGNTVWTGPTPTNSQEAIAAGIELCDPEVNYRNVAAIIVAPNPPTSIAGEGGFKEYINTEDGLVNMGVIRIMQLRFFNSVVITHELLHALNQTALHDNAIECGEIAIHKAFMNSSNPCTTIEGGNPFSFLTSTSTGHPTGWAKYLKNWGKANHIMKDGRYSLQALEIAPTSDIENINLLRIPFSNHSICIEYRKPIKEDVIHSIENYQLAGSNGGIPNEGCLFINTCTATARGLGGSHLIDTTPESIRPLNEELSLLDFKDACLLQGQTFSASEIGLNHLSFKPFNTIQNRAIVNLDIEEKKLAKSPDIYAGFLISNGTDNRCTFNEVNLEIVNNSELPIEKPFKIHIFGTDSSGTRTLFFRKNINSLYPKKVSNIINIIASEYDSIEVILDPDNNITETNEENNRDILEKRC